MLCQRGPQQAHALKTVCPNPREGVTMRSIIVQGAEWLIRIKIHAAPSFLQFRGHLASGGVGITVTISLEWRKPPQVVGIFCWGFSSVFECLLRRYGPAVACCRGRGSGYSRPTAIGRPTVGRPSENHKHRKLTNLITWTTALTNSVKLWAMPCRATQDGQVMVERSDRVWSTGEGNGKSLQYSCLENPINSVRRQNDRNWKRDSPGQ